MTYCLQNYHIDQLLKLSPGSEVSKFVAYISGVLARIDNDEAFTSIINGYKILNAGDYFTDFILRTIVVDNLPNFLLPRVSDETNVYIDDLYNYSRNPRDRNPFIKAPNVILVYIYFLINF